jgi:hypothetical protein
MSTRIKTIEFSTQTNISTLAAGTLRSMTGSTSIFIPESGITFRSVVLYVEVTGDNTVVASIGAPTIGIQLNTITANSAVLLANLVNSGENEEWTISRNVTSYFNTNWSGTSMSWTTSVTIPTIATCNHSVKILITYEYNDASAIHIKTIRIPIESTRTLLTTTYQTIGGAKAIPAITNFNASPYLPETGITIRQISLELWGNNGVITTTGLYTMQVRINGGTSINAYRSQPALLSAVWARSIINITNQNLSSDSSLEATVTTTTSRMCTVGGMIVVTYEFDSVNSSYIYNSLMIGSVDTSGWIGGPTSADQGVWERQIYVEEPGAIVLKESGLCLQHSDTNTYTFLVRCSGDTTSQTGYTSYVNTAGTVQSGPFSNVHRIDSGGQNGLAGISLKKGKNLYRVQFYSNAAQGGWNLSGFLILNYISGKHISGVGAHSHSVYNHVSDNLTTNGSRVNTSLSVSPFIPESNYSLVGFLFWLNYNIGPNQDINIVIDAEATIGETVQGSDGWISLYQGSARSDNENMNGCIYAAARDNFTRWDGDPDPDRLNLRYSRKYRISSGPLLCGSMGYWYTYNTITYIVSGTCSGYSGDGSGIPIDIYRVVSQTHDDLILNLTTTAGGLFSGVWIDNTDILYASARQDDSHVGRSSNGVADGYAS